MFVLFLFVISIALAAVAGGFSIVGLIAIYPESAVGVFIGAVIIEICKLATISYLYQFYDVLGFFKRAIAIFFISIAMLITSMGVYGYLTKGYIQQVAPMANVSAQIAEIDASIDRLQSEVDRTLKQIQLLDDVSIKEADSSQGIESSRDQKRMGYEQTVSKSRIEIAQLQSEKANLGIDIKQLKNQIVQLDTDMNALQRDVNERNAQLRQTLPPELKAETVAALAKSRASYAELRIKKEGIGIEIQKIEAKISPININIERLKFEADSAVRQINLLNDTVKKELVSTSRKEKVVDDRVEKKAAYEKIITANQAAIAELRSQKTTMTIEIQKIEAEVGPIQYVADLIYGEGENTRDKALKWFSIILVIAIDPFAVALLVFANSAYIHRNDPRVKQEFGGLLSKDKNHDTMELSERDSNSSKEEILAKVYDMLQEKAEVETKIPTKDKTDNKTNNVINNIQEIVDTKTESKTETKNEVGAKAQTKSIDKDDKRWLE